jgi:hypothetical protein
MTDGTKGASEPSGVAEIAFRIGSGTIAVMGVIVLPILVGIGIDRQLGGFFGVTVGLVIGMLCGMVVLLRLAQRWTPIARRSKNEIPYEDDSSEGDSDSDSNDSRD